MPKKSCDVFWWLFTQHKLVPEEKNVSVIDSRSGEKFGVLKVYIGTLLVVISQRISYFMHHSEDYSYAASC